MSNKTVFLGGTRMSVNVPKELQMMLNKWISKNYEFVVGDAPGIDTAFQKYLRDKDVEQVTIYTSAPFLRNNLGSWKSKKIESGLKTKSHSMHSAKDRYMAQLCDIALMVWDENSLGTISNVIDVVSQDKPCFLYEVRSEKILKFEKSSLLEKYLQDYPEEKLQAQKRLDQFAKRIRRHQKLNQKKLVSLFD